MRKLEVVCGCVHTLVCVCVHTLSLWVCVCVCRLVALNPLISDPHFRRLFILIKQLVTQLIISESLISSAAAAVKSS